MRDIKRIEPIMDNLTIVWEQHPDLRFWQLVSYVATYAPENKQGTDPFFWEDDIWAFALERAVK